MPKGPARSAVPGLSGGLLAGAASAAQRHRAPHGADGVEMSTGGCFCPALRRRAVSCVARCFAPRGVGGTPPERVRHLVGGRPRFAAAQAHHQRRVSWPPESRGGAMREGAPADPCKAQLPQFGCQVRKLPVGAGLGVSPGMTDRVDARHVPLVPHPGRKLGRNFSPSLRLNAQGPRSTTLAMPQKAVLTDVNNWPQPTGTRVQSATTDGRPSVNFASNMSSWRSMPVVASRQAAGWLA